MLTHGLVDLNLSKFMKSTIPSKKPVTHSSSTIFVPINIETIQPVNEEEIQYINQEYKDWQETNEYKHLAYSQY